MACGSFKAMSTFYLTAMLALELIRLFFRFQLIWGHRWHHVLLLGLGWSSQSCFPVLWSFQRINFGRFLKPLCFTLLLSISTNSLHLSRPYVSASMYYVHCLSTALATQINFKGLMAALCEKWNNRLLDLMNDAPAIVLILRSVVSLRQWNNFLLLLNFETGTCH